MIKIVFFQGYITNLDTLCKILYIPLSLSKSEKEKRVLVLGYKKWGEELPSYIKGYFAFTLFDEFENTYFGARDRFGVIPFYYTKRGVTLICDCFIENVLEKSGSQKVLNDSALQIYLTFSFLPGEQTFYKDIMKLMPGKRLIYKHQVIAIDSYYDFFSISKEICQNNITQIIEKNIEKNIKIMEEKDCAFMLSSGIDSNYLYSLSNSMNAYTVGYTENEFDESKVVEENVKMYKKECKKICISAKDFFNEIDETSIRMEQPVGTASSVAFMIACREIGKNAQVCITGEGADEIFAGYEIYKKAHLFGENMCYMGKTHIFEESEKKLLLKQYASGLEDYNIVKKLCPPNPYVDNLQNMLIVDINLWLEAESFVNAFKMSRANNVEIRMPFVNEELFEIAHLLPSDMKIVDGVEKYILREISKKKLPKEISNAKKRGFVIPIRTWMTDKKFVSEIESTLEGEGISRYCDTNVVNCYFNEFIKGNQKLWRKIWCLYAFSKWYNNNFLDK